MKNAGQTFQSSIFSHSRGQGPKLMENNRTNLSPPKKNQDLVPWIGEQLYIELWSGVVICLCWKIAGTTFESNPMKILNVLILLRPGSQPMSKFTFTNRISRVVVMAVIVL